LVEVLESIIAGKTENALWGSVASNNFLIEKNIPNTRCRVQRLAGLRGVEESLLSSGMSANEGNEIDERGGLVGEKLNQDRSW